MSRHLTHHTHIRATSPTLSPRPAVSKRRSNRMALQAAVGLSGEDSRKATFNSTAKATNLNKHGAAIQLHRELSVGSTVIIKHQRGTEIVARVVSQISAVDGLRTYGVEFVEHDERARNFWGISFPSA